MNQKSFARDLVRLAWLLVLCSIAMTGGCDSSQPVPISTATETQASLVPPPLVGTEERNVAGEPGVATEEGESTNDEANESSPGDVAAPADSPVEPTRLTLPSDTIDLSQRAFMTLQPLTSASPEALIDHLRQIDAALQDLVLAGSSNFVDEQTFKQAGLRLGGMKREAGKQLADSPAGTPEQQKAGIIAQLVALSHMSGLGDVAAAQELERYARELASGPDPDIAHQAQVVLLGFELQSLQNGLSATPEALLAQVGQLFPRVQDRGFPEFMVLQQAQQVLSQMGFEEAAEQIRQTIITAYRTAPDRQLRGEAWLIETQQSQAYQNFVQAFRELGRETFEPAAALASLRGLYQQFPSLQSLEQIASTITNIEFSGYVPLSQDVAQYVQQELENYAGVDTTTVQQILDAHAARTSLIGQSLPLSGLIGFDGQPLQWQDYQGKVVLVDFWASWCIKCLRELPVIRQTYADFASQGFAVIGINMDENLTSGQSFVEQQQFPWRSFHSDRPDQLGFNSELAQKLGVNAIPLMLLIGRDGRVAALHVRGEQLKPAVMKLLEATPPTEPSSP